jgi:hypothetical protein
MREANIWDLNLGALLLRKREGGSLINKSGEDVIL